MSEPKDMTCAELADVAAELALGVLTGRERAMAVAHLDKCDACREDVRQLMATGEQLLELLPSAEPPAGFETRVLERLGLPVSAQEPVSAREPVPAQSERREGTYPQLISHGQDRGDQHSADQHSTDQHRADQYSADQHGAKSRGAGKSGARSGADRPGGDQHSAPPARPGGTRPAGARPAGARRTGRMRRVLAAAAVVFAVVAAGLGGWRIGLGGTGPAESSELTSASLHSATGAEVGDVYFYSDETRWVFMSIDMGSGNEAVKCQLVSENGTVTQIGTFRLADGHGSWGSPDPGIVGSPAGARLVSDNGTVLASGTFGDS